MSDPITVIILAFQSIFAPAPAVAVPPPPPVPATVIVAATPGVPSWAPPISMSLPVEETPPIPAPRPAQLSCSLERKGSGFVAVVVADASYSIDYDLVLRSNGSNKLSVKKHGEFDLTAGKNRQDLNSSISIGGQKILGELTLHGSNGRDTSCSIT